MKRSALPRRRPHRKGVDLIVRELWRENLGPCAMRGITVCEGKVRGHHIVEKRALKRRGLDDHLWDRRNRLALCDRHHRRHHSAHERVPASLLSEQAWEFAGELNLTYLLERYYPVTVAA